MSVPVLDPAPGRLPVPSPTRAVAADPWNPRGDPRLLGGDAQYHGPSPILGPDGQPYRRAAALTDVDKELLGEEVAAPTLIGTRSFSGELVASGMTPGRLAVVLRDAARGSADAYLTLAEEMEERDLNYAAALGTRKRALSRLKPTLDATGVEPRVVEAVREIIEATAFHTMVKDALDAIGKGFSVNEIIWGARDGLWWPQGYRYRDPRFFTFDYISKTELRLADLDLIDGYELPPAKFIRHVPKMKSGIPIRGGLARTVAWAWMFKMFSLKDWMSFLDVYGMPMRVGKYHPNATEAERRALLRAVGGIASDAAAIIPESMTIEFIESKGYADQPFKNFGEYLDDQIATYVLGQTLTTGGGGSYGQAKIHNDVRLELVEDDAFELEVTINRDLVRVFVDLNFGAGVKAPVCEFRVPKPEQVSVIATALGVLVPLGLEVAQEDVRKKIGMPTPAPGAALLSAGAGQAPTLPLPDTVPLPGERPHMALNRAATAGELVGPGGLDDAADWQAETGPMLDAIMAAANTAGDFEQFRASLRTLYGALPTDDFNRRLAEAAALVPSASETADHG